MQSIRSPAPQRWSEFDALPTQETACDGECQTENVARLWIGSRPNDDQRKSGLRSRKGRAFASCTKLTLISKYSRSQGLPPFRLIRGRIVPECRICTFRKMLAYPHARHFRSAKVPGQYKLKFRSMQQFTFAGTAVVLLFARLESSTESFSPERRLGCTKHPQLLYQTCSTYDRGYLKRV